VPSAWAGGVNWHLDRHVELMIDYEHTAFTGGAVTGDRVPEQFVVTRLQIGF
jgi:phosphate-selective porin